MPNAFRILKPIHKNSKCVWVFRSTGANAVAKNQTRLAYEDKRDLYGLLLTYGLATRHACYAPATRPLLAVDFSRENPIIAH